MNSKPDPLAEFLSSGMWRSYHSSKPKKLMQIGASYVDNRLQGGIVSNGLHEFFGKSKNVSAAAPAFALMLALRLFETETRIIWISGDKERQSTGRLYPQGLVELGADPLSMIWIQAKDLRDALRAAADSIKSKAAGAIILEAHGNARMIDLISTRRLALAAEESGVLALLVRGDAAPMPSAAVTRWEIVSAPSTPLPGNAPGLPTFDISLLRHRGGIAPFQAKVIWDHAARTFHDAPLSGGISAVVTGREANSNMRTSA